MDNDDLEETNSLWGFKRKRPEEEEVEIKGLKRRVVGPYITDNGIILTQSRVLLTEDEQTFYRVRNLLGHKLLLTNALDNGGAE